MSEMRLTFEGLEGQLSVIDGAQEDRYIVDIPFNSVTEAGRMFFVSDHPYVRGQKCASVEEMVEKRWLRHVQTIVLSRSRVIAQRLNEDDVTELIEWAFEAEYEMAEEGIGPVLPKKFGGNNRGHDG